MNLNELREAVEQADHKGHAYMQLVMTRKRAPQGRRVKVAPGVFGDFIGEVSPGRFLVDVEVLSLKRLLDKAAALSTK